MKICRGIFAVLFLLSCKFYSQVTFPNATAPNPVHTLYAFTNAVIHSDHETVINNGTLLFGDGKIISTGEKVIIPAAAVVFDLKGKHIYPSFI